MKAIRFTVLICLVTANFHLFAQEETRPTVASLFLLVCIFPS